MIPGLIYGRPSGAGTEFFHPGRFHGVENGVCRKTDLSPENFRSHPRNPENQSSAALESKPQSEERMPGPPNIPPIQHQTAPFSMRMLMHLVHMPRMIVIVRPVIAGVVVVVGVRIGPVRMLMLVLVQVLVRMAVGMLVGVGFVPMGMFMGVGVTMLVGVQMLVFVFAFHQPFSFLFHFNASG